MGDDPPGSPRRRGRAPRPVDPPFERSLGRESRIVRFEIILDEGEIEGTFANCTSPDGAAPVLVVPSLGLDLYIERGQVQPRPDKVELLDYSLRRLEEGWPPACPEADPVIDETEDISMIPLHDASISGDAAAVRRLLSSGVAVDARDEEQGNTALIIAAYNGHPEIVKLLVDAGADVEARCFEGETALMKAGWSGSSGAVEILLEAGAEVDARSPSGMTALMIAAFHGRADVVDRLLAAGADAALRDEDGFLALDSALSQNETSTVRLLEPVSPEPTPMPDELFEVSANFDPSDVELFLVGVAGLVDGGLSNERAVTLATEVLALEPETETQWIFRVSTPDGEMPLYVVAFMDDVASPDLYFFTKESLAVAIEELLGDEP